MATGAGTRQLDPGQSTRVWTWTRGDTEPSLVFESSTGLFEAPNWLADGTLLLNGDGDLHLLDPSGALTTVPIDGAPPFNNDHVPAPDGRLIYASANDGQLYAVSLADATASRLTTGEPPGLMHFLHGVSPDGTRLAFVGLEPDGDNPWGPSTIFTVAKDGTDYRRLTDGSAKVDGCEYSPDGGWIYYNTEEFDGHAQIARMRPDGTGVEQLTFDDRVNWFPHLCPDGRFASYIAFPPGTEGHPPNVWVEIRHVELPNWNRATTVARVFGGQGSFNVNSWRADSTAFAFVSYPPGD